MSTTFSVITLWTLLFCSMTHYDITIGNDVARDVHSDIIMGHDVAITSFGLMKYPYTKTIHWNIQTRIHHSLVLVIKCNICLLLGHKLYYGNSFTDFHAIFMLICIEKGFGFLLCDWLEVILLFYHIIIQFQDLYC